jgi:hypothetical protein
MRLQDRLRAAVGSSSLGAAGNPPLGRGPALAGSAFDGTWRTNLESVKTSGKPDVYLLAGGEYTCSSCSPELKVEADGAEHKVSGHAYYDTVMVNAHEQVHELRW